MLIAPATPYVAPKIGQEMIEVDGAMLPVRPNLGVYTQPISCIGLPVIAAPIADPVGLGTPGGMPIGVQLIAAPWAEEKLFRVAARLEQLGVCASPTIKAGDSHPR